MLDRGLYRLCIQHRLHSSQKILIYNDASYKKARAGEIKGFTGIDDPYEAPLNPEIVLNSHEMSLEEEVELLINLLRERGILQTV